MLLLKEELRNHRKNIEASQVWTKIQFWKLADHYQPKVKLFHKYPHQDLNQIILEKDSIVQGLQDEVGSPAASMSHC